MCGLCQGPVNLDDVYLFPCYHAFHTQCLTDEVCGPVVPYAWQRLCSSSFSAVAPTHTPPTLLAHPANSTPVSLPPPPLPPSPPPLSANAQPSPHSVSPRCLATCLQSKWAGSVSCKSCWSTHERRLLPPSPQHPSHRCRVQVPAPGRAQSWPWGPQSSKRRSCPGWTPPWSQLPLGQYDLCSSGVRAFEAQCFRATMARSAPRRTSIACGVGEN